MPVRQAGVERFRMPAVHRGAGQLFGNLFLPVVCPRLGRREVRGAKLKFLSRPA